MGLEVLKGAVSRTPLVGHDGRSGARLERVVAADGSRLLVKTAYPGADLTSQVPGGLIDREVRLWASGQLDRLPAGVAHCIVEAGWDDGAVVTAMRDLGDAVVGWGRELSRSECRRVLDAAAGLHRTFADQVPEDLCSLEDRLLLLTPAGVAGLSGSDEPLPAAILRGWECF